MSDRCKMTVLKEAVVIGLLFSIVTCAIKYLMKKLVKNLKWEWQLFLSAFLAGALLHITFEYMGYNKEWCTKNFC